MAESDDSHPHLELAREEPVTERRTRPFGAGRERPDGFQTHADTLRRHLQSARRATDEEVGGYDERRLIKIKLTDKVPPEELARAASGIEIVSQEEGHLVLAFATNDQLDEFEAKLVTLADGGNVSYRNVMYALQDLGYWTPDDRKGWALRQEGFPEDEPFLLDVELWPLDRDLKQAREAFEGWLVENHGEQLDAVRQPYLTLYRVRCSAGGAERLLNYRDVRTVDLPPRLGLELSLLRPDVEEFGEVPPPPDDAPGVVVLDTGLATGHPMLAPAVGDAQTFLKGTTEADEHGHGTMVAGIALYDDVAACVRDRRFTPTLRLFSGRILDDRNEGDQHLIQNQVEEAVRYFVDQYGCRVFNLAYGDLNKPYQQRHITGLAVTLDALSREQNVLFVVPTGNFGGDEAGPVDWRAEYPAYLGNQRAPLLDPAPALNVLTVGALARYDQGHQGARHPNDPNYQPVARVDQPSPFTRAGPSVNDAIKPDLVDYGGNYSIDTRGAGDAWPETIGELSTSREFAAGQLFAQDAGTSFATPHVAHAAARLLAELPEASPDLCRALLVAHARPPQACTDRFADDADVLRNLVGYGLVDRSALYRSLDGCVTLWAEEAIENRRHHFYEVPLPAEFWEGARRERKLTVALAYRPPVRTTRIEYRAVSISFNLVKADSLAEVARSFDAATDRDTNPSMSERGSNREVTSRQRSRGTVQSSTWTFKQPSRSTRNSSWFVVVTRNDPAWGAPLASERESYALTVTLADRLAYRPRLYTRIEARVRARARARATS